MHNRYSVLWSCNRLVGRWFRRPAAALAFALMLGFGVPTAAQGPGAPHPLTLEQQNSDAAAAPVVQPADAGNTPPSVPKVPTAATSMLRVANEMNVSMSIDTKSRVGNAVGELQNLLLGALNRRGVSAVLIGAAAQTYAAPGDDEIALADAGIGAEEIFERIENGYLMDPRPLALMTVAERGGYVIAAAYLFFNDNGNRALRRVSRFRMPAADVDTSTVVDLWPACFAEAIARDLKIARVGPENPRCQQNSSRAPATRLGHAPKSPPAKQPPSKQQPSGARSQGLLEGIPSLEGAIVTVPPTASPPETGGESKSAARSVAVPRPQPQSQPLTVPPPAATVTSPPVQPRVSATEPPRRNPIGEVLTNVVIGQRLWEQILAHGFVYSPKDEKDVIPKVFEMLGQNSNAAECLKALQDIMPPGRLTQWMVEDFFKGDPTAARQQASGTKGVYDVILNPARVDSREPRSCLSADPLISPISYSIPPGASRLSFTEAEKEVAALNRLEKQRSWRFPTTLEGFAIASARFYHSNEDSALSFWVDDKVGHPGIVMVTRRNAIVDRRLARNGDKADLLIVRK